MAQLFPFRLGDRVIRVSQASASGRIARQELATVTLVTAHGFATAKADRVGGGADRFDLRKPPTLRDGEERWYRYVPKSHGATGYHVWIVRDSPEARVSHDIALEA